MRVARCTTCGQTFQGNDRAKVDAALKRHKALRHGFTVVCRLCEESFTAPSRLAAQGALRHHLNRAHALLEAREALGERSLEVFGE